MKKYDIDFEKIRRVLDLIDDHAEVLRIEFDHNKIFIVCRYGSDQLHNVSLDQLIEVLDNYTSE